MPQIARIERIDRRFFQNYPHQKCKSDQSE
nr:MAG TPA: hypothetical protein [Caudoviricetes sp.]